MNGASLPNKNRIIGLILVGGKSSRMHKPKAHLTMHGRPQWQACLDILRPYCESVLFSTSPQLEEPLPVLKSFVIEDVIHPPIGPLGGIMSAFNRNILASYFVLACDLLLFDKNAAELILARRNPHKLATVFVNDDDKVEPLCGIYEPAIFSHLAFFWSKKIFCPREILNELSIERVEVPKGEVWLKNINHKYEYEALNKHSRKMVTVRYYAALCEGSRRIEEEVFTEALTVGELFLELKQKYDFKMGIEQLRFALNDSLVNRESPINNHDAVVFMPPVSGG